MKDTAACGRRVYNQLKEVPCMKDTADAHFRQRMILCAKQHGILASMICCTLPIHLFLQTLDFLLQS